MLVHRQFGIDPKGKSQNDQTPLKKKASEEFPEAIHQICGQAAESITSFGAWPSLPELQGRQEQQLELQPVP